jgi:hypothetical protein
VSRHHREPSGSEERATGKDLGVASGGTHRDLEESGRSRKSAGAARKKIVPPSDGRWGSLPGCGHPPACILSS